MVKTVHKKIIHHSHVRAKIPGKFFFKRLCFTTMSSFILLITGTNMFSLEWVTLLDIKLT